MDNGATIAIIDSNLENRADLQKMLEGSEFRVVADAGYGVEAAATVKEAAADCILLSLEEPVVRGLQTMRAIAEAAPNAPIIVYSSQEDRLVVRQAMQAGARDYLRMPLTPETLVPSIRYALEQEQGLLRRQSGEQAPDPAHGMVVTVFGTKGGIGKTTIAANLALAVARETTASVVLVDMDLHFGCVTALLDVRTDKTLERASRDVQSITHANVRDYLFNAAGGIWVLPVSQDPAKWEAIDPERIRKLLTILSQTFDYVILDTPGALNEAVAVALEQATIVLLITSLDITSARNTRMALGVLNGWSYPEERIKLVINHPNSATELTQRAVMEALGRTLFWEIPFDLAVSRSVQKGKPLVLASPRSKVGQSITALARKIGGIGPPVRNHRLDGLRSVASFLRKGARLPHGPRAAWHAPGVQRQPSPGPS